MPADDADQRTVSQIEADLANTRKHLADTVDQLTQAAQPKAIVQRKVEGAKASFASATRTDTGELRVERVAAAAAAALAVVVAYVVVRRRRS